MSNTLHQFQDDDLAGVRPVIEKIVTARDAWKKVRAKIEYFDKTGRLPEIKKPAVVSNTADTASISELKLEIARLNTNISKARKKLELTPDHKKAELWQQDLLKMEAIKAEYKTKIIEMTYATTQ
ncbi:hypothetical protein DYBT9275_00898 [Dyadobacter sp. CECT 9275]|uniref:Uncharacterized protein n=1 Tax=Dyadobacter helix TaxID=2822344 RepID=A0A916JAZ6_9BACT|nr:hypothetical protein [Dyadobacter sp. CECT 9275]CAG4992122.1 hypothetical protein DYBT9275_00898 [Dyadobacter sp. CECT 9275]